MPRGDKEAIDWSLTTWEGAEREQLRRWAGLSLEEILLAQEDMQKVTESLQASRKVRGGQTRNS